MKMLMLLGLLMLLAVGCDNTAIERELGTLKAQLAEQEAIKARFTPDLAKRIRKKLEELLKQPQYAEFSRDGDFDNHIAKLGELERSTAEHFGREHDTARNHRRPKRWHSSFSLYRPIP